MNGVITVLTALASALLEERTKIIIAQIQMTKGPSPEYRQKLTDRFWQVLEPKGSDVGIFEPINCLGIILRRINRRFWIQLVQLEYYPFGSAGYLSASHKTIATFIKTATRCHLELS